MRCTAEELIQASTTRPARSALSQHAVTLPALRFSSHSIALQAASASPGHHFSSFVFGTSDRLGIMPQGRHTGMKTEHSATTAARIAVLPRVHGPRANCGKSLAVLRGTSPDYGSWSKWAQSSLGSRSLCLATPFCPFLAKTGDSRWDFLAIFFFIQFDHTEGLYGFQY